MQYHVLLILLHRPFLPQADKPTPCKPSTASESQQGHAKVCKFAADKISQIFRAYRSHYTIVSKPRPSTYPLTTNYTDISPQRNIPISGVHAAFTAAVIHLYNAAASDSHHDDDDREASLRCCRALVKSLYEMNVTWFWCNRSIRVIESLAVERGVDLWGSGMAQEIGAAHFLSLQRYNKGVVGVGEGGVEVGVAGADLMAFDAYDNLFTTFDF
jgi:hypothetical protein